MRNLNGELDRDRELSRRLGERRMRLCMLAVSSAQSRLVHAMEQISPVMGGADARTEIGQAHDKVSELYSRLSALRADLVSLGGPFVPQDYVDAAKREQQSLREEHPEDKKGGAAMTGTMINNQS